MTHPTYRISLLIRSLEIGGAERQLALLARQLKQSGHQVVVNTFYKLGPFVDYLEDAGIEVVDLAKRGRYDVVAFLQKLKKVLAQQAPDIVYSFSIGANIYAAALKGLYPKAKYIWGVRTSRMDPDRISRLSKLVVWLSVALSYIPDAVIFNSRAGRTYYGKLGYAKRNNYVVHNGIDLNAFNAASQTASRDPAVLHLGLISRIDPLKHIENLFYALKRLEQLPQTITIAVTIVGEGDSNYADHLKQIVQHLGLSSKITWLGSRQDVDALYKTFDVFVSTSVSEGFSNSILEAMASGVPCIVTDVGDSAFLVGEAGYCVPAKNDEALYHALVHFAGLSVEARQRLQQLAVERVHRHFTVDCMFSGTLSVFAKLCNDGVTCAE